MVQKLILTYVGHHDNKDIMNEIIIGKAIKTPKDLLEVTFDTFIQKPYFDFEHHYKYIIVKIGGFGEYYADNSPR